MLSIFFRSVLKVCLPVAMLVVATEAGACVACAGGGCVLCTDSDPAPFAEEGSSGGPAFFSTFGGRWPQPGGLGSPVTITYSYNNFLDGGLKNLAGVSATASYLRTVTEEAFGLWASVAPLHFVEVPDVGTPIFTANTNTYKAYSADDFGQIRLNHRFINGTDAQNGMPTTKALAYAISGGPHLAADIHFDNGDPWEIVGTPSAPDVLGILTHEIGHSIGMGHSTIDGTVMFRAALRRMGPGTGVLMPDDIAGIRAIYGAGVGSVTSLSVPEPTGGMLAVLAWTGVACVRRRRRVG